MKISTWQEARELAFRLTGRSPRWCDAADADGEMPPAPTEEAMNDCLMFDADGNPCRAKYWLDGKPAGVQAACYF